MKERHALVAGIGPEVRGADALGHGQAECTAGQRAEKAGQREVTQQPFEGDGGGRQAQAKEHVDPGIGTDRTEEERRIRNRACKEQAGQKRPSHEYCSGMTPI